jgi:phosphoglycolate phosphatase
LCIGDEIRDLEAAAKAGIPFGAVAWGFTQIEALQAHAPAEVFMRMDEIAERIL